MTDKRHETRSLTSKRSVRLTAAALGTVGLAGCAALSSGGTDGSSDGGAGAEGGGPDWLGSDATDVEKNSGAIPEMAQHREDVLDLAPQSGSD